MKTLVIQIPCYNEQQTLALALKELPREVPGFEKVMWVVIDDGSADETARIASENGVDCVVRHAENFGLARAFMTGLETALRLGADVIVNTDADNQYCADDIPKLTQPILDGDADMVIGTRPIADIEHFSPIKKALQKLGSGVLRRVSGTTVEDATSGFRAVSRKAATHMNVFNCYTYTLETIIQAGSAGIAIQNVPIRVNEDLRPSRLVKSISSYVGRSIYTMLRIYIIYSPFRFFAALAGVNSIVGLYFCAKFIFFFFKGLEDAHVPSILLGTFFLGVAFILLALGILASLLAVNRRLLEDIQRRGRLLEWKEARKENGVGSKSE